MADIQRSQRVEILSRDEADTLRAIVQGSLDSSSLRQPDLYILNRLRLIMAPSSRTFIPTALGIAWCRTFPAGKEPNGR
jgi:hypothetical protein